MKYTQLIPHKLGQTNQIKETTNTAYNDHKKIIYAWNATEQEYPEHKTIHQLFEEQVKQVPDNIALICENTKLTYNELNHRANQLASYLRTTFSIESDDLIALCLDRSEHMLIVILAVLKSGAAYVPIDPIYPDERISYILEDTKTKVVLTNEKHKDRLKNIAPQFMVTENQVRAENDTFGIPAHTRFGGTEIHKLCVIDNTDFQVELRTYQTVNLTQNTTGRNLAYVIYTSGTTGKPKGVMIEHHSIVNRLTWMNKEYPLSHGDCILQKTPYVFDVSVWELFWAIWYGANLVLAKPDGHKDPEYLINLIHKNSVSIIHFVPSMLGEMLDVLSNQVDHVNKIKSLRYVFCSGEALKLKDVKSCHNILPNTEIHNLYGPTETCIDSLYYACTNKDISKVYIGTPISNTKAYILDDNLIPLPIGEIGELYIGGAGLSRGYLNQPELTTNKFIVNPFQNKYDPKDKNARLYKTGDLVRCDNSGNLEYIGRNDFQVKVRGFRVELGEIENILSTYPNIKQAVVIQKTENEWQKYNAASRKYLAGYYIAKNKLDESKIFSYLSKKLPNYMLPDILVWLTKLPLTINGKLDRGALPNPVFITNDHYVAPQNAIEVIVCSIFTKILSEANGKIGINDNFFRLGGDSILAIRLVGEINHVLNTALTVHDVFISKSVANICTLLKEYKENNHITTSEKYTKFCLIDKNYYSELINSGEILDIYPASYLQMGMLLESGLNSNGTYHDVFCYSINYKFDCNLFMQVWDQLIAKHETLRSRFITSNNGFICIIHKNLIKMCEVYYQADSSEIVDTERLNDFDYTKPGLFRLIINVQKNTFDCIFSLHHVVADGWSISSLINEFIQAYTHSKPILSNVTLCYGEFVHNELLALNKKIHVAFWKNYLSKLEPPNKTRWKFKPELSHNGIFNTPISLKNEDCEQISILAKINALSLDSIFIFAYIKTLAQFLNLDDVTIGLVVNNRLEKNGGDRLAGLFLNTIPYHLNIKQCKNNYDGVLQAFMEKIKLYQHQSLPYGYVKSLCNYDFIKFAFVFVNFHILDASYDKLLNAVPDKMLGSESFERTNIPFVMTVSQHKDRFHLNFVAHDDFIDQDYLNYFANYLINNLKQIIWQPNSNSRALLPHDYQKIIYEWNKTEQKYPDTTTIYQLFEEQVNRTPTNIAVVYENTALTYKELNVKANQLAHYLREEYQIIGDNIIALFLNRSEYMLIAILATLKSGAAYAPIDPSYPDKRIKYILKDTKANVVLTNDMYQSRLKNYQPKICAIDTILFQTKINKLSSNNLSNNITCNNLAYVIYTSGTTGSPKGVMIEHKNVVNLAIMQGKKFYLSTSAVKNCLWYASYIFDAHVSEVFTAIIYGHVLYIVPSEIRPDLYLLQNYIKKNHINIGTIPPALLNDLELLPLETLVVAGESSKQNILDAYCNQDTKVINAYGPTESTVCATLHEYRTGDLSTNIGRPISNIQTYVLDANVTPTPIGVIGDLYIGGSGIARGYLNQTELTREKFVDNPFQTEEDKAQNKNARLYKTGDLVRYLPDGNLEYIGRNDFQVKIRGFRIELGEIEAKLATYPNVKQAVVIIRKPNNISIEEQSTTASSANILSKAGDNTANKYIVGCYVADYKLDETNILEYLSSNLPDYMVPNALVWLEKLPLTINSKLDRHTLRGPEFINPNSYIAPATELDSKICAIFTETLGLAVDKVGMTDDFFRLGGNSILAIKLVSALKQADIAVSINALMTNSTPAKLSHLINQLVDDDKHAIVVPLKLNHGAKQNIFVIHAVGGNVIGYMELVNKLSNKYNYYGIQNINIHGKKLLQVSSLQELAQIYVNEILKIQNNSEFIFLGVSMGGNIGFEMSRQLIYQGKKVKSIYMLDTWTDFSSDFQQEESFKTHMAEQEKYIAELKDVDAEILHNLTSAHWDLAQLLTTYKPVECNVPIVLLKAKDLDNIQLSNLDAKDNGWGSFTNHNVEVYNIDGNHYTMLLEPGLSQIESILNHHIDSEI